MRKLVASVEKELLLLLRDRTGILLLFAMPAVLVVLITLIQENVLKTSVDLLFVDKDKGEIGAQMEDLLALSDTINLVKNDLVSGATEGFVKSAVAAGNYQFGVVIPEGISAAVEKKSLLRVKQALYPDSDAYDSGEMKVPEIMVWYDPTVQGSFKSAIGNVLTRVVAGIEMKLTLSQILEQLPDKMKRGVPEDMKAFLPENDEKLSFEGFGGDDSRIIEIKQTFAAGMGFSVEPTSVQQNVPAWTLFGIFFIVVPVAGSLIRERTSGTLMRLTVMPVSYGVVLLGKVIAYNIICFGQFAVILAAGKFLLPVLGADSFNAGSEPLAFALIIFSASCAATGYGIFLGAFLKTYEQASMFGPVSVVIAAAVGGILVPVYTMPEPIRSVSSFSPLAWGQNAFYDILLRGGEIFSVLPEVFSLLGFFCVTTGLALVCMFRRDRSV